MNFLTRQRERRRNGERGAAMLEFALLLPVFFAVVALVIDTGDGFLAARSSSAAARAGARIASQNADEPQSDYRALAAIVASFERTGSELTFVSIYRTDPSQGAAIPNGCAPGGAGVAGTCNVYGPGILNALDSSLFDDGDCAGSVDLLWCPSERGANSGEYLGVAVWGTHDRVIGLVPVASVPNGPPDMFDRSVFPIFLPEDPVFAP